MASIGDAKLRMLELTVDKTQNPVFCGKFAGGKDLNNLNNTVENLPEDAFYGISGRLLIYFGLNDMALSAKTHLHCMF